MATIARTAAMPSSSVAPHHRRAVEDRVGEAFDLAAVEVAVRAQRRGASWRRLEEDSTSLVLWNQGMWVFAVDAAVLAVDLEALLAVHAHGDGQIEVAERAVGEVHGHEPAVGAETFGQPRVDRRRSRRRGSGRCRPGGCRGSA